MYRGRGTGGYREGVPDLSISDKVEIASDIGTVSSRPDNSFRISQRIWGLRGGWSCNYAAADGAVDS